MSIEHTVLVVTRENDPQFSMLKGLPHIVGHEPAAFASAVKDPVVILAWSGPRKLMRDVFTMCQDVRWVHSRSAGLDSLLFPELVASDVPLTNGSGVFSQSLGEFALGAILYFAKDFRRMIRNQMAGVWEQFDVEEISTQTVGIVGYGDIGRAVAKRVHPMGMTVLANKRHPPQSPDPMVDQFYKTEELPEMLARCDYVVVCAPADGRDPAHDQRCRVRGHEAVGRGDQHRTRAGDRSGGDGACPDGQANQGRRARCV